MDINNITGLEKPLEKLVETISEGIGTVGNHLFGFDAARAKRVGDAEAAVERKRIIERAEAQEEALAILDRASKRFSLEQYNKQINLENILVKAREDLSDKTVSEERVEKDWTVRFLDIAQNVSREEIQTILAKILSGEIQKPGSCSYQTLEVMKYLSQRDLQIFLKFVAISTDLGVMKLDTGGKESLEKYGLDFHEYLYLSNIGLFNQSSMISYSITLPPSTKQFLRVGNESFTVSHEDQQNTKRLDFGLFVFSNVGIELRTLLVGKSSNDKSEVYKTDFLTEVERKGFRIVKNQEPIQ